MQYNVFCSEEQTIELHHHQSLEHLVVKSVQFVTFYYFSCCIEIYVIFFCGFCATHLSNDLDLISEEKPLR